MHSFINTSIKICSFFIASTLLIGCAYIPKPNSSLPKSATWEQHQQNLNSLNSWHTIGKIGFNDGKQGGSASLTWQQQQGQFDISLYGPFRTEKMRISGIHGQVQLSTSNGVKQTARTAEEIIVKQLGWTVPVTGLIYWSKGLPIPGMPVELIQLSEENRLVKLRQQGWIIIYHEYKAFGKFVLPTKITLQYNKIKIKLIFKSWL